MSMATPKVSAMSRSFTVLLTKELHGRKDTEEADRDKVLKPVESPDPERGRCDRQDHAPQQADAADDRRPVSGSDGLGGRGHEIVFQRDARAASPDPVRTSSRATSRPVRRRRRWGIAAPSTALPPRWARRADFLGPSSNSARASATGFEAETGFVAAGARLRRGFRSATHLIQQRQVVDLPHLARDRRQRLRTRRPDASPHP